MSQSCSLRSCNFTGFVLSRLGPFSSPLDNHTEELLPSHFSAERNPGLANKGLEEREYPSRTCFSQRNHNGMQQPPVEAARPARSMTYSSKSVVQLVVVSARLWQERVEHVDVLHGHADDDEADDDQNT